MKFLLTREVGRLAKWLRILGFDARYEPSQDKSFAMLEALKEERVLVTRNRRFGTRHGGTVIFVTRDAVKDQLKELFAKLSIGIDRSLIFSRCTLCNIVLAAADKRTVEKEVPAYVYLTSHEFMRCSSCGRIYWKGTHWGNVEEILKEIT